MRIDEIVILTLKYLSNEEGEVEGRTLLQKTIYFLNEKLNLKIPFIPYYYGPYSEKVSDALQLLISVGMIEEKVDTYSQEMRWLSTFEPRLYKYIFTDFGLKFADRVEKEHKDEAETIKQTIQEIKNAFPKNVKILSIAGKMLTILNLTKQPMTPQSILEEARALNWEISEDEAEQAIHSLEKLGLIKTD